LKKVFPNMTSLRSMPAIALACAASMASIAHAEAPRVGVTGAVNPAASGTPPGAATRQLVVGSDVIFRERVITTAEGQAQILFLDQSALMIGPNSTVVIDEFVYDPDTSKGNIAATLTQGSFRYIGGKLSKQGNATLRTPVATIGIRGSDVTVTYDRATSEANVVTTHGSATVETPGGVLGLRTGFGTTIGAGDRPPGPATALTAEQIVAANAQFEGTKGKSAGASEMPTDKRVSESGLGDAVEAQALASIEPAAGGASATTIGQLNTIVSQVNQAVTQAVQQAPTQDAGVLPSPPPPQPGIRTDRTLNGFVAGLGFDINAVNPSGDTVMNDLPTDVEIRTIPDADGVGRVLARFAFRTVGGAGHASSSAWIEMGDAPGAAPATQSDFFDDTTFSAEQTAVASAGKAQIDSTAANVTALMVTLPLDAVGVLTGGAANPTLCTCEFVNWGIWVASLDAPSSQQSLQVPGGFWVAGALPDVSDPSPQGSATFSGAAVGIVHNAASAANPVSFRSGSFTNVYNFSQRSGNVTISNFDGRTFGGTVHAGSDWRTYSGSLSGSNLTGSANGAFYGNRNGAGQVQMPKETAGNFSVHGTGYTATGVFAGSR
jgi:hypothetical protein